MKSDQILKHTDMLILRRDAEKEKKDIAISLSFEKFEVQ